MTQVPIGSDAGFEARFDAARTTAWAMNGAAYTPVCGCCGEGGFILVFPWDRRKCRACGRHTIVDATLPGAVVMPK